MTLEFEKKHPDGMDGHLTTLDETKKTILIYSPDLNFCFSLSMLFQDRYNVITTTNPSMLETFVTHSAANLLIMDASPSEKMLERLGRKAAPRDSMKQAYLLHLEKLHGWLGLQSHMKVLRISYNELLKQPAIQAERVCQFLSGRTNIDRMVETVDPSLYRNRKVAQST